MDAELRREPGFVVAALRRRLDTAADEVWRTMIDHPGQWLAAGRIEAVAGGRVRLDFEGSGTVIDSAVTACEPGRAIAFSWSQPGEPARPVRWEIDAAGLTITLQTPDGEDAAKACAGWEAHLAMLEAALAGAPIGFPFEVFKAAREAWRPKVAALAD